MSDEQLSEILRLYKGSYLQEGEAISAIQDCIAQPSWQPIETAPRDGTPIIVCNSRHRIHAPVVVRWLDEMSNPDTGWCDAATASGDALYFNPNYFDFWMPTPTLPSPLLTPARGGGG